MELPFVPGWRVERVRRSGVCDLTISARSRREAARCPDCRHRSTAVHGYYQRRPADLPLRQGVRTAALVLEPSNPIHLISAPPLAQCRPLNATAPTDKASIAKLLVKPHPAETRSGVHEPPYVADRSARDLMNGACRPQLHSHNQIINLKAIDHPKRRYNRRSKSERMSPNPTDYDAVHAALSQPWSTGPVEGHINRLKLIKRDMYGGTGFDLLRSRVLAA